MMGDIFSISHVRSASLRIAGIDKDTVRNEYTVFIQGGLLVKDRFSEITGGFEVKITDLVNSVLFESKDVQVFLKGGEPFLQAANLGTFAEILGRYRIPVITETFYSEDELKKAAEYNRFIRRLSENSSKVKYMGAAQRRKKNPDLSGNVINTGRVSM